MKDVRSDRPATVKGSDCAKAAGAALQVTEECDRKEGSTGGGRPPTRRALAKAVRANNKLRCSGGLSWTARVGAGFMAWRSGVDWPGLAAFGAEAEPLFLQFQFVQGVAKRHAEFFLAAEFFLLPGRCFVPVAARTFRAWVVSR